MPDELIDLAVSLADGDATVTVRITAWPTRHRWGWDGDPGSPGEWEIGMAVSATDGGRYAPVRLTDDDRERIDRAVAEWLAEERPHA